MWLVAKAVAWLVAKGRRVPPLCCPPGPGGTAQAERGGQASAQDLYGIGRKARCIDFGFHGRPNLCTRPVSGGPVARACGLEGGRRRGACRQSAIGCRQSAIDDRWTTVGLRDFRRGTSEAFWQTCRSFTSGLIKNRSAVESSKVDINTIQIGFALVDFPLEDHENSVRHFRVGPRTSIQ